MIRLALCLLALPSASWAARTTAPATVDELANQATDVVVAEVVATRTVERGYQVSTTYTLVPTQQLKGLGQAPLALTLPGGILDGLEVQTANIPVWRTGDRALLFLADEALVTYDGALTVRDQEIVDGLDRAAEAMPLTIQELENRVLRSTTSPSHN